MNKFIIITSLCSVSVLSAAEFNASSMIGTKCKLINGPYKGLHGKITAIHTVTPEAVVHHDQLRTAVLYRIAQLPYEQKVHTIQSIKNNPQNIRTIMAQLPETIKTDPIYEVEVQNKSKKTRYCCDRDSLIDNSCKTNNNGSNESLDSN